MIFSVVNPEDEKNYKDGICYIAGDFSTTEADELFISNNGHHEYIGKVKESYELIDKAGSILLLDDGHLVLIREDIEIFKPENYEPNPNLPQDIPA